MPRILEGQVAVVTGASRGIGAGIAETLARAGASVVITGRDGNEARAQADVLRGQDLDARGMALDVTSGESCKALASGVLAEFGRVDVLVNNAGVSGRAPLADMDDQTWDDMIAVNLTGVQRVTRAIAPLMSAQRSGSIVSISSVLGRAGKPNMAHYCATKFGVIGFAQALALELAPFNVRVNCVCPGIVRTRPWETELEEIAGAGGITVEEAWASSIESVPLGRPQSPQDIGNAVAFLASGMAANITGQSLNVDGGFVMS